MDHIKTISALPNLSKNLIVKFTGKFYTHETVANNLISHFISHFITQLSGFDTIRICDPFAGDGRLVYWLIKHWQENRLPKVKWEVFLWDIDEEGLIEARRKIQSIEKKDLSISCHVTNQDSFKAATSAGCFDIVITNPPWEILKPDARELRQLNVLDKNAYLQSLRNYDKFLSSSFPRSQPIRKFAGWGTNLSRVGLDLSTTLTRDGGWTLIVLPSSFFADEQSARLRSDIFTTFTLADVCYYPAEARLFGNADTGSATLCLQKTEAVDNTVTLSIFDKTLRLKKHEQIDQNVKINRDNDFSIPISFGTNGHDVLEKMKSIFASWGEIEGSSHDGLWAGREIDETGSTSWLSRNSSGPLFIKGRMIDRYKILETPTWHVSKAGLKIPVSSQFERIVWRDVARQNQKRRMIATIAPKDIIAGNSLGVCYYKDRDPVALKILLGILNSLCFEYQLRSYLATGHISLSAIRRVRIPDRSKFSSYGTLLNLIDRALQGDSSVEFVIEAFVAKVVYRLSVEEFGIILSAFEKIPLSDRELIMSEYRKITTDQGLDKSIPKSTKIPNHVTSNLSALDLTIVNSVPPGGNWKNIPMDVPSNRIKQIRESYAEGKGSRSTYYGRLEAAKPSYTINTYFNRPGNGCHIHYKQDRVLSQREAARLQSFPDSYIFCGTQGSINTQIGNAVPPLLACQIALQIEKSIGCRGMYVDLFSGAGGMGLGFKWAGWDPIVANDIDKSFLDTYANNLHPNTIVGSIADDTIFDTIVQQTLSFKTKFPKRPLWILGGPPCQGFSTAGNKRTMEDQRNLLFLNYTEFLRAVKPDGFVFENVAGLLNMEGGKVFGKVRAEFEKVMPMLTGFTLNSENFAIPQRRKRVFLIGRDTSGNMISEVRPPTILTSLDQNGTLFDKYSKCVSVEEALDDLPELVPGQNGSFMDYQSLPKSAYQKLMRGQISPIEYLALYQERISSSAAA